MMMNLFNIFDPASSHKLSLNWMSMFIFIAFVPLQFWLIPSRSLIMFSIINKYLFNEFKSLINYSSSNIIIFSSLFIFITMNNFMGLFPYIFTSSSHLSFSLSLSLSMWLGMMIFGWFNFFSDMMTHLTPLGTPFILMPFMVLIELISLLIRPITLSIRLSANMIAGHLLLSLLGSSGSSISITLMFIILFPIQLLLLTLEIAVSLIQAYVFSILSALYSSEI
nr:ATP synthase F0 subunit 6 [Proceratium itoi]